MEVKDIRTKNLIEELVERGAVRIDYKLYSKERVYVETERFTNNKTISEPKAVLILDTIKAF